MEQVDIGLGLIWFLAFLFSTTVHEAMHALAARRLGDSTAYQGGQVSLNPAPHVAREPIGMVVCRLRVQSAAAAAARRIGSAQRYPPRAARIAAARISIKRDDVDGRPVVAWRVFPLITHPLFGLLLRIVHPFDSYS